MSLLLDFRTRFQERIVCGSRGLPVLLPLVKRCAMKMTGEWR